MTAEEIKQWFAGIDPSSMESVFRSDWYKRMAFLLEENEQIRAELAAEKERVGDLRHFRKVFRDQRDEAEAQVEVLRKELETASNIIEWVAGSKLPVDHTGRLWREEERKSIKEALANLSDRAEAVQKVLEAAEEAFRQHNDDKHPGLVVCECHVCEAVREWRKRCQPKHYLSKSKRK